VARTPDGVALGCGALRHLGGDVLAGLEEAALERGWRTLRLETGPRQPEAIGLYERAGYRSIGSFGAYIGAADADDSLFYERTFHVS
jgi:ribosomal protein S18 acetylase RimI-like enzyme